MYRQTNLVVGFWESICKIYYYYHYPFWGLGSPCWSMHGIFSRIFRILWSYTTLVRWVVRVGVWYDCCSRRHAELTRSSLRLLLLDGIAVIRWSLILISLSLSLLGLDPKPYSWRSFLLHPPPHPHTHSWTLFLDTFIFYFSIKKTQKQIQIKRKKKKIKTRVTLL